jgi:hypothetical protein
LLYGVRKAVAGIVDDGIDTFVFKDEFNPAQTVRYTLQKK